MPKRREPKPPSTAWLAEYRARVLAPGPCTVYAPSKQRTRDTRANRELAAALARGAQHGRASPALVGVLSALALVLVLAVLAIDTTRHARRVLRAEQARAEQCANMPTDARAVGC